MYNETKPFERIEVIRFKDTKGTEYLIRKTEAAFELYRRAKDFEGTIHWLLVEENYSTPSLKFFEYILNAIIEMKNK